jgi:hypothetical protein
MYSKFNLTIFACIFSNIVFAEIGVSFSLIDLVFKSNNIIEAKYIGGTEDNYQFIYRPLGTNSKMVDTLEFENVNRFIETNEKWITQKYPIDNSGTNKAVTLINADFVLFFLKTNRDGTQKPIISGYRVIKNEILYSPYQNVEPGKHFFVKSKIKISDLLLSIEIVKAKYNEIINFLNEINFEAQKKKYSEWLTKYSNELSFKSYKNNSCGWGSIGIYFQLEKKYNNRGFMNIPLEEFVKEFKRYYPMKKYENK